MRQLKTNESINEDDTNCPILPDPRELLLTRNRWERLTFEQKKVIYKLIRDEEVPIHIIRDKFSWSESTIKRIVKMFEEWTQIVRPDTSKIEIKIFKSKKIRKATTDFILNKETPFTSKDVCAYLKNRLDVDIDSRTEARYMKNSLSMSFKKASSRPTQIDTLRIHRLKVLYSIILSKQLNSWKWIVNVDESSFSRLTKKDYTWLLKGIPGSVKNVQFSGSINLISAISTTGASYSAIAKQTTDSECFCVFISKLFAEIEKSEGIDKAGTLLILDNAPWHQSKATIEYLNKERIRHLFLPQYSPDLAPVELFFGQLKGMAKISQNKNIRLLKQEGIEFIATQIKKITKERVSKIWSHLYRRLRYYLEEVSTIIKIE